MTTIALLGDKNLDHLTHRELNAATELFPQSVQVKWMATDRPSAAKEVAEADGLWVIPGTPYQSDDTVYEAIRNARATGQPFLGTCGGFQYAVIEYARHVANLPAGTHAEVEPDADVRVVGRLACSLIAQERQVSPVAGTKVAELLGVEPFTGYHYCNYGLADAYIEQLTAHGLTVGAWAPDAGVEAIELADHRFFIATLFQPQVGTLAGQPLNRLITAFIEAAANR